MDDSGNKRDELPLWRTKKFFSACIGTILAALPVIFSDPDLDRQQRMAMWQGFVIATSVLWGGVIVAQGAADYAERRDAPSVANRPGTGTSVSVTPISTQGGPVNVQSPDPPVPDRPPT